MARAPRDLMPAAAAADLDASALRDVVDREDLDDGAVAGFVVAEARERLQLGRAAAEAGDPRPADALVRRLVEDAVAVTVAEVVERELQRPAGVARAADLDRV